MTRKDSTREFAGSGNLINMSARNTPNDFIKNFDVSNNKESVSSLYQKAHNFFLQKDYKNCVSLINEIYRHEPAHLGAMELHGAVALAQSNFETAEIIYSQLAEKIPDNADFQIALGQISIRYSNYDKAEPFFNQALILAEDEDQKARAYLGRSKVRLSMGRMDEAKADIRAAHQQAPAHAEILYMYAIFFIDNTDPAEELIEKIKTELGRNKSPDDLTMLYFALSKLYRITGQNEESFLTLKKGCETKRNEITYDPKKTTQKIESAINYFSKDFVLDSGMAGVTSQRPIFIVSMPRSGTTLLEQILTSHEDIGSIGEDPILGYLFETTSYLPERNGIPYPLRENTDGFYLTCEAIAHQYNNYLFNKKGTELKRIINKGLGTRLLVGLLYMMFPNARFIHIERDPLDCLLSCYSSNFVRHTQPYSYDLEELGLYYRDHRKLMRHWKNIIPAQNWLDIKYEDLVANQEAESKRIFAFLDMEWTPACLSAEKSKNPVSTASAAQVREAIHTKAIGKWGIWKDYINPLLEILEAEEDRG